MTSVSLAAVIGGAEISGVTRAAIALVLVVAALLKLVRPGGAVSGLVGLGLPRGAARSLVAAMTVGELAVATLLITGSGYLGAALAGALLVGFSSYLVVLTRRAPSAQCGCFGDDSSKSPYAHFFAIFFSRGYLSRPRSRRRLMSDLPRLLPQLSSQSSSFSCRRPLPRSSISEGERSHE